MAKFIFTIRFILIIFIGASVFNAAAINDPTRPFLTPIKSLKKAPRKTNAKQQLTAIFNKQGTRQAIINDKLYKIGDYFLGKKIVAIKSNSVLLRNSQGTSRLTLVKPIKKIKNHANE